MRCQRWQSVLKAGPGPLTLPSLPLPNLCSLVVSVGPLHAVHSHTHSNTLSLDPSAKRWGLSESFPALWHCFFRQVQSAGTVINSHSSALQRASSLLCVSLLTQYKGHLAVVAKSTSELFTRFLGSHLCSMKALHDYLQIRLLPADEALIVRHYWNRGTVQSCHCIQNW